MLKIVKDPSTKIRHGETNYAIRHQDPPRFSKKPWSTFAVNVFQHMGAVDYCNRFISDWRPSCRVRPSYFLLNDDRS